jgi:hypothetical protein
MDSANTKDDAGELITAAQDVSIPTTMVWFDILF